MIRDFKLFLFCLLSLLVLCSRAFSQPAGSADTLKADVFEVSISRQYESVRPGGKSAFAISFNLEKDWHFYASEKTAPGGMNLKVKPSAEKSVTFLPAVFPKPHMYFDRSSGSSLEVFSDSFTVYVPFVVGSAASGQLAVELAIEGAICSQERCRMFDNKLTTIVKVDAAADMSRAKFTLPQPEEIVSIAPAAGSGQWTRFSVLAALGLAFLAGLSLNIMPCVWPVLPLIIMRIITHAKQSKARSVTMGLAFCLGILFFFAVLAAANIVLQLFYGGVLQWGDQFRSPAFVAAMAVVLVALALFMFDVFTVTVPSAVSSKTDSAKGYTGAVGMGFLAAVLSTPCSFAILAAAFAWAQAQPLGPATLAIMVIGVGMAAPYAILTSTPTLLNRIPKPGKWMGIFKKTVGFILLLIAVKLIAALPQVRRTAVLYFSVVISFCIWMWFGWVDFNTKLSRKLIIRIIALLLAVSAGWSFLRPPAKELIDWQQYDAGRIKAALDQNQPVLIKFTADWCFSCQVVEKTVYSKKDIADLIEKRKVLAVKADTTVKDYPATLDLKNVYNEPGVPVSMLFVPGRKEPVRWHGLAFADDLREYLQKLPHK